jgi:choline dehydrogenase-like flavoprotein
VLIEDGEARVIEYLGPEGLLHGVASDVVGVAAGALATPGLLMRPGLSGEIGRHLGFHPARLVEGLFDEIQDAHMVYPITAHCMKFRHDADGGFVVEAATVQDPIGFATALCDERGTPLWGDELVATARRYRHFTGLLTMVNDENHGTAWVGEDGVNRFSFEWSETERERLERSLAFAREVLLAAGGKRVFQTGVLSTHVQGGCRMGTDPQRSVVDAHGECHEVRRLFVGDGSVIPRTLSVNPSLTIMALAARLAEYLDGGEHGYFASAAQTLAA